MKVPQRRPKTIRSGKEHHAWKGGRFHSSNGYIWIWMPDHPFASKVSPKGYVLEHRFVAEQKLGRPLTKKEIVHHLNGIRDDNRKENLVITEDMDITIKDYEKFKKTQNKAKTTFGSTKDMITNKSFKNRIEKILEGEFGSAWRSKSLTGEGIIDDILELFSQQRNELTIHVDFSPIEIRVDEENKPTLSPKELRESFKHKSRSKIRDVIFEELK